MNAVGPPTDQRRIQPEQLPAVLDGAGDEKNTTPSMMPITVRVPAPVVRKRPEHERQREQGHDDDREHARDARPVADLVRGGIETVAPQMIDVGLKAAQREQFRIGRGESQEIRIDGRIAS